MTVEWSIATPVVSPIAYVRWTDGEDNIPIWFVYVFGTRTGSIQFGKHTCYYRSAIPRERGRLFVHFDELRDELERIAALVACVNAHLVGDGERAAA